MKTTIYINLILSVFLIISCEKEIPEAAINCTEIMEQDGISYFNNRDPLLPLEKFTGSCYTIYDSTLEKNEIRTIKKREEKLNREVISEYTDFDIVFVERC